MNLLVLLLVGNICHLVRALPDIRAILSIVSPPKYGSLTYGDGVIVNVNVEIIQGQVFPQNDAKLCITEVDIYSLHPGLKEGQPALARHDALDMCTTSNSLDLGGYLSGTHNPIIYLRIVDSDGQYYIIAAVDGVFQTILDSQLVQSMSQSISIEDQYELLDSITLFKSIYSPSTSSSAIVPLSKIIGIDHPISKANRSVHKGRFGCINIVFYLKEIQHHGANNRLLHWLFDSARFREHGYCLSVVTSSNNASHNMALYDRLVYEAGVEVKQYDCLSLEDNLSLEAIDSSLAALNAYFYSDSVQVVIAVNTFGDDRTHYLLFALHKPLTANLRASDKPFLFVDLPNLLTKDWPLLFETMDGVLAPSRYAGFTNNTASHGKHIAVIYPPACSSEWIIQSPCYSHFINYVNNSALTIEDARRAKKHVVLSSFMSTSGPTTSPRAAEKVKEVVMIGGVPKNRVKFISVARLDTEKCPALLLMALKHIRDSLSESELNDFDRLAQFDVYGGGPLHRSLNEMVAAFGLQHLVTFRGAVSESGVMSAMQQSDVLINPIIIGETFGFVHTEAGVMGLPVIAFRSGANAESISSGILVDRHSNSLVEDLAVAIIAYYQKFSDSGAGADPSLCAAAKTRVAQWNIHRHSDSLMDAVNSVLNSSIDV